LDLNRDFRLDGPPRWSPSGNEIYFYGVRKREAEKPGAWWIAPLNGGDPRLVRLSGVTEDLYTIVAWIRAKDDREWIVYYSVSNLDAWNLLRVGISAQGQLDGKPEQLTSGTGRIGFGASLSEDGKLAYFTAPNFSASIYEIPTDDRGQKLGPTLQLPLSGEEDERSPSVSRDGRWLAYDATRAGKPNTILLRDLRSSADRFLDDKNRRPGAGGAVSISPDGSKVIFSSRDCKSGRVGPLEGTCGFMVSAAGGQPELVCEACTARGFSSNGSIVLIQKYDRTGSKPHDRIVALDLITKIEKDFLNVPGKDLYHAYFSSDDHWAVFKQLLGLKGQILIAPVRNGVAAKEAEWIVVTDGRYSDDKPQFSPDGNTVYFTSTRDGYLCIWAQRLDPLRKHPLGSPVAYEHFHNSMGRDASDPDWQMNSDLTVATNKILINLPQTHTDIWMVQVD
jgi:Tol biopolymer transport system component